MIIELAALSAEKQLGDIEHFHRSPPGVLAIPSVIMFRQNGQPVARVFAPVATASCARRFETRCSGGSSNHIRPPARAAAEGLLSAARHLAIVLVVRRSDDRPRRVDHAIHAREVTGIVQGDRFAVCRSHSLGGLAD